MAKKNLHLSNLDTNIFAFLYFCDFVQNLEEIDINYVENQRAKTEN